MNIFKNILFLFIILISLNAQAKAIQTRSDYAPVMIFDQMVATDFNYTYTLQEKTSEGVANCQGTAVGKKFEHRGKNCLAWKVEKLTCDTSLKKRADWLHHVTEAGYAMACEGEDLMGIFPEGGHCEVSMSIAPHRIYSKVNLNCSWKCNEKGLCEGRSIYQLKEGSSQ